MVYRLVGGLFLAVGVFGIFSIFGIWRQFFGLSFDSELLSYFGVVAIAVGSILWSLETKKMKRAGR